MEKTLKQIKSLLALVLAAMMVMAMGSVAFADTQDSGKGGSASITITLPTDQVPPSATTTYKIYKVFDATSDGSSTAISYKLVNGKTTAPTGFTVDTAGNVTYTGTGTDELTEADIAAIAEYVGDSDLVYTANVAVGETTVVVTGLEYGYYYITTTSGTVVTIDSTNPNADVIDKNIIPKVVKSPGTQYDAASLEAIAAVGTSQPYTAVVTSGKGMKNVKFTDTMTNQTYNGDAKVYVGGTEVAAATNTFTISGAAGDSTFSIAFADAYIASLAANTEITIKYSGTITSDGLSVDPATNKAKIESGEGNSNESDEVKVYNAKLTVSKEDGNKQPLAGAGFVIKNSEGKYYKLADDKKSITWFELPNGTTLADAIAAGNITEYTSNNSGEVTAFTGLGVGTYTLVESTTPAGYNTAADIPFEVKDKDFSSGNLNLTSTVINNAGAELPSTGGIGTTIFYIAGAVLVLGAAAIVIARRKAEQD